MDDVHKKFEVKVLYNIVWRLGQGRPDGSNRQTYAKRACTCFIGHHQGLFAGRAGQAVPPQLLQPHGAHGGKGFDGQSLAGDRFVGTQASDTFFYVTFVYKNS